MQKQSYRYQRTIARPVEVRGVGYLTGAAVCLRLIPAPPQSGVVFIRTDLDSQPEIHARVSEVTGTQRRTTLGREPNQVSLVEHVLAALAGLRIDNCRLELDGPEPPGLDGSALDYVNALLQAGIVLQPARRPVWTVSESVTVSRGGATLALHPGPADRLKVSYFLDYGSGVPIARQSFSLVVTPESFANELAVSRTFLLESEAEELRRQGFGTRTTAADLLIFGRRGPVNNCLRFANEPARHKVLDLLGDLSLFGQDLRGHLVGYRSGHELNIALARQLSRRAEDLRPRKSMAA